MSVPAIFFYLFSGLALASALLMVLQKNPVTSAFYLVLVFFSLAGIYVLLDAHLLAALQIFVYTGAIMVLFIFVIMLLNADVPSFDLGRTPWAVRFASVVLGVLFFMAFVWVFKADHSGFRALGGPWTSAAVTAAGGNPKVLSYALFSEYLFPFELTSLLLLAAIVGSVAIAKRKPKHLRNGRR